MLIREEADADRAPIFAVHAAAFPAPGAADDLVISVVAVLDADIVGHARAGHQAWQRAFELGDPPCYERFGSDCAVAAGFSCRCAGSHVMAPAPNGDALPRSHGEIAYPSAFDSLD